MAGVCGCLGGWWRPVSRGPGLRAMVGVCRLPDAESGRRGRGGGCVGVVGLGSTVMCPCMCPLAAARLCGYL